MDSNYDIIKKRGIMKSELKNFLFVVIVITGILFNTGCGKKEVWKALRPSEVASIPFACQRR